VGIFGGILVLFLQLECFEAVSPLGENLPQSTVHQARTSIPFQWPDWMDRPQQVHPEILQQLHWSLRILEAAAESPLHAYSKEALQSDINRVVYYLNQGEPAFSPSVLGHLGEIRAAAYLVSKGYRLISLRKKYFAPEITPHGRTHLVKSDFDLIFEDPIDPSRWWAIEVKTHPGPPNLTERRVRSHYKHQLAIFDQLFHSGSVFLDPQLNHKAPISKFSVFILEKIRPEELEVFKSVFPNTEVLQFPPALDRAVVYPSRTPPRTRS
jgi:hypothetical protein